MSVASRIREGASAAELAATADELRASELARHAYEAPFALLNLATRLEAFLDDPIGVQAHTALHTVHHLATRLAGLYAPAARLDPASGTPVLRDEAFDPTRALLEATEAERTGVASVTIGTVLHLLAHGVPEDATASIAEGTTVSLLNDARAWLDARDPLDAKLALHDLDHPTLLANLEDARAHAVATRKHPLLVRTLDRALHRTRLMHEEGIEPSGWVRHAAAPLVQAAMRDDHATRIAERHATAHDVLAHAWAALALREAA